MTKVHVNYQIRAHAQNLPIIGGVRQREVEEYDASACLMGKSAQISLHIWFSLVLRTLIDFGDTFSYDGDSKQA